MSFVDALKGGLTGFATGGVYGAAAGALGGALGGGVKATAESADVALDGLSQQAIWNKVVSTEKQVAIEKSNLGVQEVQAALRG